MTKSPLNILKINAQNLGGGAANVANALAGGYRKRGHNCVFMVGNRRGNEPGVIEIPDPGGNAIRERLFIGLRDRLSPMLGRVRGAGRLHEHFHCLGLRQRLTDRRQGIEDWNLPASHGILDLSSRKPDIVQCHNLHSFRGPMGHFDLRALPNLCRRVPVVLTLHDAWLTTGHCAHPIDCQRWTSGCGDCPDLCRYPPVKRDSTAENWQRKRDLFSSCRLYVASPSGKLLESVRQSILAPAMIEGRTIPNGIDCQRFRPGDRNTSRHSLGLPKEAFVLLFSAQGVKGGSWKDFPTMRRAAELVAESLPGKHILFLALGEAAPDEKAGAASIRFVPYQKDPDRVAEYYRAADIYVHAAHMETFPLAVLEAMACGIPVAATAVGGIPEQVSDETGVLVQPGDSIALADGITDLLNQEEVRRRLSDNAARIARERYGLDRQVDLYLSWFRDILDKDRP